MYECCPHCGENAHQRSIDLVLDALGFVAPVPRNSDRCPHDSAVAAVLLLLLESVTGGWGVEMHYFHLPYLNDGSLIEQLCIYFVVLVNMYFLGFVSGSIYRRFGRAGTLLFFLIVFLLMSIFSLVWTYLRWWGAFFHWFSQFTAFELALLLLPLTAIYLLVSYLLLRRAVA